MSEENQDKIEDTIKEEKEKELLEEYSEAKLDAFIDDNPELKEEFARENFSDFIDDIIKRNSFEFRDFAKERMVENE